MSKITQLTEDATPTHDDLIETVTDPAGTPLSRKAKLSSLFFVLQQWVFGSDAGSTDTYVVTLSPAPAAYVTGQHYRFKANTANTGACTVNFNGLGAKTIKKAQGGITTDLADNDIRAGQWVDLVYDGTNMQMQSTLGNAPTGGAGGIGDVVGPASATDNAITRYDTTTGKLIQNSAVLIDDNGGVTVPEIAAPSTPATGKVVLYAKTDGLLYSKDDVGTEFPVSGGTGTTINPTNNLIPYRSNSTAFADSRLSFDSGDSGRIFCDGYFNITRRGLAFGSFNDFGGLTGNRGSLVVTNGDSITPTPGSIYSPFAALPAPGGTPTPWTANGMNYRQVLTGNTTIGNPGLYGGDGTAPNGYRFLIMLVQDPTGGWTVTWSSDFKFPGGTAPTMTATANAVDIYEFIVHSDIAYSIGIFQDVK